MMTFVHENYVHKYEDKLFSRYCNNSSMNYLANEEISMIILYIDNSTFHRSISFLNINLIGFKI